MTNIICNIPHASTNIPNWARKDIIISAEETEALSNFMVDKDIDKMWDFVPPENKQVATVSRLIVDTERYRNDKDEPMSQKGMGLYYTHTPEGKQFRLKTEDSYQKCLEIYDEYHKSLENKVSKRLEKYGKCIILDCHSFHDGMTYTGYDSIAFPDVCIGVNGEVPLEAKMIIETFKRGGCSVKLNSPFSGSLVPLKHLNDTQVVSVMIELNRRIYDNDSFSKLQLICKEIYDKLCSEIV